MNWLAEKFDFKSGAILNFYKPKGKTSFWIVHQVRKMIDVKVGHTGTLDPFAEGVLILCTGRATKKVSELMELPKEYVGEIGLGIQTNTDDITGEIVKREAIPDLAENQVHEILVQFTGDIYQQPPMFSAKKVDGQRLYKLARAGKVIERKPSLVHIENISLLSLKNNVIKIKVTCSKGTYIRALARDIGEKIGCGGYLKSLIRTRIGSFHIEDALSLTQFAEILDTTESTC